MYGFIEIENGSLKLIWNFKGFWIGEMILKKSKVEVYIWCFWFYDEGIVIRINWCRGGYGLVGID